MEWSWTKDTPENTLTQKILWLVEKMTYRGVKKKNQTSNNEIFHLILNGYIHSKSHT